MSTRKLKPYFQASPVTVLMTVPLQQVMHKLDLTGRMTKWVLKLSEYEIDFQPQRTLQAQALLDFVAENTLLTSMEPKANAQDLDQKHAWVLRVDGSAGQQHQGVGFVHQNPDIRELAYTIKYEFTTGNES